MALTRVLIAVKTYPTLSSKYDELVCTAGFREDGSWVRIYPIPFRRKNYNEQYRKYDWIEMDLVKNTADFRPESYRPASIDAEVRVAGHLDTASNWKKRKEICLRNVKYNLRELILEAKNKEICRSLAVFKPSVIVDFYAEPVERYWKKDKLDKLGQLKIFERDRGGEFKVVRKLPYKFSFRFKDDQGLESRMMIEDWETGQLYWNCLERHNGNEQKAVDDVRRKYLDDFARTKDLHFFLGTTLEFHQVGPNPFIIIGTFHPPRNIQPELF